MKLDEKGRYAPPPTLPEHAQRVSETLSQWPDVLARTHWQLGDESIVDGADFYVGHGPGAGELGHLHLYGEAHVLMPTAAASAAIAAGLARRFAYSRNIVVYDVVSEAAADHALWLFQLNYDHLRGARLGQLLDRIAERATLHAPRRVPAPNRV